MDKVIKSLAKKYGVSTFEVEQMVKSQFSFVKNVVEAGEFKSVRLKHLGLFTVKKNRLSYYKDGGRKKTDESE